MLQRSLQYEDIKILNMYAPNSTASRHMKWKETNPQFQLGISIAISW